MNLTPLQANFSAGELSPLMVNRTELEGHAAAVEIMENVIALSQGPFKSRDPYQFVNEFIGESFGRVGTIQLSPNRFLIAVFLDFTVQFFLSDGSPVVAGLVFNPRFSAFGDGWTTDVDNAQSVVAFNRHVCILSPRNNPAAFALIKQEVTVEDVDDTHAFVVHSDVEDNNDQLHLLIGTADGLGDILDVVVIVNDAHVAFNPGGNAIIFISVSNEAGGIAPDNNIINLSAVDVLNEGASGQIHTTPYPSSDLRLLQFIEAPEGDTIYITHPRFPQQFIEFDDEIGAVLFASVVFTNPPAEWADSNFPATGVVHKGRIYYAGSPLEPEQIWASVIGDLTDMTAGVNPADGFSVVNSHFGAIAWMLSTKDLIFGTTNAEYLVTAVGAVIFIGDIQIDRQSTYGSISIRGQHIGDKVLYITRDAKRLHAMQFNRDNQTWLSDEISFPSEHIMRRGAIEFIWEQYPHDLIWIPLIGGSLACCNYNRPMNVYGWHQHNTQGTYIDIASGSAGGVSLLIVLVVRESGNLMLEITDPSGGAPIDSRVSRVPDGFIVDGLEHLEGQEVQVVADGAVHPDRTVEGGEITLQVEASFVQVGLGYRKRVRTLPLDKGSQKGSGRAYVKRYKDIYLALLNSAVPFINGQLPPIRTPQDLMDVVPPLTTGLVKVHNLGYDREAIVDIIQDGPLILQVTGIYGEVIQEKI